MPNASYENKQQQESSLSSRTMMSVVVTSSAPVEKRGTDEATRSDPTNLDFIGPSHAVKELFTLPYSSEAVSVAVHNMNGTLLMEGDVDMQQQSSSESAAGQQSWPRSRLRKRPVSLPEQEEEKDVSFVPAPSGPEEALQLATSLLQLPPSETEEEASSKEKAKNHDATTGSDTGLENSEKRWLPSNQTGQLLLPPPENYPHMPPLPEPRQYLPWHFWGHDLLVGSDVLVYHSHQGDEETVLRVADMSEMKSLLRRQQDLIQSGHFISDRQPPPKSYADALSSASKMESSNKKGFAAPNLEQVKLQTHIVPTTAQPTTSSQTQLMERSQSLPDTTSQSPVCTVLDAYLDNIIANVPQLALCLREKGFIQSVKLFRTEDIPSCLMRASTVDGTSSSVSDVGASDETPLFSPKIMEMNASALLRFLKANCTRDNATYLLRREAGETNIQLYDISAISAQRQRKWIWWLATMSYRFALRLGQVSNSEANRANKRMFRARQRSLLETALELLGELADMDGEAHETLCAAVRENLADTFLVVPDDSGNDDNDAIGHQRIRWIEANPFQPDPHSSQQQPYTAVTVDALSKAQDHLIEGIRILWTLNPKTRTRSSSLHGQIPVTVVQTDGESSDDEFDTDSPTKSISLEVTMQLFGLHHKLIYVLIRLAEHHLNNYFSSSAMQALRSTARRLADAVDLLGSVELQSVMAELELQQLQVSMCYQYIWLWEHCGHFARSFAADDLWRERGHACGDDVISVLRDVEKAFDSPVECLSRQRCIFIEAGVPLTSKTKGMASLQSLSGVVMDSSSQELDASVMDVTRDELEKQKQIQRDQRRVLVAASISYSRAISALGDVLNAKAEEETSADASVSAILSLLRKRLGDACNEIGKIMLNELRSWLKKHPESCDRDAARVPSVAQLMLYSSQFWFMEGLDAFEECSDLRNIALLRCNLCQCCKLRANSNFASTSKSAHAEACLQEAADHLQMAHKALGEREVDPMTWDMVSDELAATFLVLGVRRRQSLLGGGTTPIAIQTLRLSPGEERLIVDPMEKALTIYDQLGNAHQAAATNYQLALFFSKVWTCQRDEAKTREKLSAAFRHYGAAHAYFSRAPRGNEPTFLILCLDLSNLYAAVAGEECLGKALMCCLDTSDSFSPQNCQAALEVGSQSEHWLQKMCTLATAVDERVFKLLMSLVKMEKEGSITGEKSYKELYRVAVSAKVAAKSRTISPESCEYLSSVHELLVSIERAVQAERNYASTL